MDSKGCLQVKLLNNEKHIHTYSFGFWFFELGNEEIILSHPFVHHISGTEIFINAQKVHINGPIQVQVDYKLTIQALDEILIEPGGSLNPDVHLSIKKDFYNIPMFEYADNAATYNFCDNNAYVRYFLLILI